MTVTNRPTALDEDYLHRCEQVKNKLHEMSWSCSCMGGCSVAYCTVEVRSSSTVMFNRHIERETSLAVPERNRNRSEKSAGHFEISTEMINIFLILFSSRGDWEGRLNVSATTRNGLHLREKRFTPRR